MYISLNEGYSAIFNANNCMSVKKGLRLVASKQHIELRFDELSISLDLDPEITLQEILLAYNEIRKNYSEFEILTEEEFKEELKNRL